MKDQIDEMAVKLEEIYPHVIHSIKLKKEAGKRFNGLSYGVGDINFVDPYTGEEKTTPIVMTYDETTNDGAQIIELYECSQISIIVPKHESWNNRNYYTRLLLHELIHNIDKGLEQSLNRKRSRGLNRILKGMPQHEPTYQEYISNRDELNAWVSEIAAVIRGSISKSPPEKQILIKAAVDKMLRYGIVEPMFERYATAIKYWHNQPHIWKRVVKILHNAVNNINDRHKEWQPKLQKLDF